MQRYKQIYLLDFHGQEMFVEHVIVYFFVFPGMSLLAFNLAERALGFSFNSPPYKFFTVFPLLLAIELLQKQSSTGISRLYGALPVAKKVYVQSRFLLITVALLLGWLISLLAFTLSNWSNLAVALTEVSHLILLYLPLIIALPLCHLVRNLLLFQRSLRSLLDVVAIVGKFIGSVVFTAVIVGIGENTTPLPTPLAIAISLVGTAAIVAFCNHTTLVNFRIEEVQ